MVGRFGITDRKPFGITGRHHPDNRWGAVGNMSAINRAPVPILVTGEIQPSEINGKTPEITGRGSGLLRHMGARLLSAREMAKVGSVLLQGRGVQRVSAICADQTDCGFGDGRCANS